MGNDLIKKCFVVIISACLICLSACRQEPSDEKYPPITPSQSTSVSESPNIETDVQEYIVISYDSLRKNDSLNAIEFETVADHEMTAWLFDNSRHTDVSVFHKADELFGTEYATFYEKYMQIRFPKTLYQKIFPDTENYRTVSRQYFAKGTNRSRTKQRVTSYYGTRVTEEQKYSQLYSIHEMESYLQLIFTAPAKYGPDLHLVTVSKNNLQLIDEQLIYHSFVDAGETDISITRFAATFEQFETSKIKNHENWGKVDTTMQLFVISSSGEITEV